MKRLLSYFAFKRLEDMISILACSFAQLGSGTLPSGYFSPLHTFPHFRIFPHSTIPSKTMGMKQKYCIVLCLSICIAPLTAVSTQWRLKSATKIFSS